MLDIIGHESLIKRLSLRIKKYPTGTYLFYGPSSSGKRTTAFASASFILCEKGGREKCGCRSCKLGQVRHPDFLCVGRSEKIVISDVERILSFSETSSFMSNYKVVVIDNAHNITWEAANRLLKLLEEPPPNFSFFLVSDNVDGIIPTIVSRCVKFKFGCLSRDEIIKILVKKLGYKTAEAKIVGYLASGTGMDVFSDPNKFLKYRLMAVEFFFYIKKRKLIDSLDFLGKVEFKDLPIFCDLLNLILTDILLLRNGVEEIVNEDLSKKLMTIANSMNRKTLIMVTSVFSQLKRYQYLNVSLSLVLKSTLLKCYPYIMVAP